MRLNREGAKEKKENWFIFNLRFPFALIYQFQFPDKNDTASAK